VPLASYLVVRGESLRVDRVFGLMLLLLGSMVASAMVAKDKVIALGRISDYFLEGLILYWLVVNVVRDVAVLRRVVWTLLAAGALLSSLSAYQSVTGSYDQEFGGLAYRHAVPKGAAITAPPAVVVEDDDRGTTRARGPVNEPNRFAQMLIVLVPLAIYMYRTAKSRRARVGAALCGALVVVGMGLTLSRGAFVSLVLLTMVMMGVRWIRPSRWLLCVLALTAVLPTLPFLSARVDSIVSAGAVVGDNAQQAATATDGAVLGRITLMRAALHTFIDHPIIGVGPGQFPPFYSGAYADDPRLKLRNLPDGTWRAHSLYLEIAAEEGIIGITAFLLVVWVLMRELWRLRCRWLYERPDLADLVTAFWLSTLAYLLTGLFLHLSYQRYFWLLIGVSSAALQAAHARAPESAGRTPAAPWPARHSMTQRSDIGAA
jgi:O-antigen ligase